jgi:branched-chain amino acid transport system permease protein
MVDLALYAQLIVSGLLSGGMLALAALGLTLIFGVLDVVNFAHGTYVMLAMYAGYWAWEVGGIDPFIATLLVGPLFFVFGVICERLVIQPVIDRPMYAQVFGTVGLLWIFENGAQALFGPNTKSVTASYGGFSIGGVAVQQSRLYGFIIAVIVTGLLVLFLNRTKTGLAIRATAQTRDLAEPFGVNIERIFMITFGLGIGLIGVAGSALIATRSVEPTTGNFYVLLAFVIVTLGGLSSIYGTFLAGLFIGIADSFISFFLSPEIAPPIYFALFIGVMVLRAKGYIETLKFRLSSLRSSGGVAN